jgi:hypothetical protein
VAIPLATLRQASLTESAVLAKAQRVRKADQRTAFLCHSHKDSDYVLGFVAMLRDEGWDVYVDWEDASMPAVPDDETARKIKRRIETANFFLFLATPNSMASRWCPWEIGYADGVLPIEKVFVVVTSDNERQYGNEYLNLYPSIDLSDKGKLGAWSPGTSTDGRRVRAL